MLETVISLINCVVQAFPRLDFRPNSVVCVDDWSEFQASNFGQIYQDYLNGHFWARNWVASGAHPDKLKKEYPMLMMEHRKSNLPEGVKGIVCERVHLVLVDKYDCEQCKHPRKVVSARMKERLKQIIVELSSFRECVVEDAEGCEYTIWTNPCQLEALGYTLIEDCGNSMEDICEQATEFSSWSLELDKVTGWEVELNFCFCTAKEEVKFDYYKPDYKQLGVPTCENCK